MAKSRGSTDRRSSRAVDTDALVAAFRAWVVDGPDCSTLTFSKRGGSVRLEASTVHGGAMDLLQRMAASE